MITADAFPEKNNEELLADYLKTRDNAMKQALVLRYRNMVKTVALQMRGVYASFTELDDVINEGIIALMQAIERFDPSKNVKFESYASLRIRGTIVDLARRQDWIPRSVRKMGKAIDFAEGELRIKLGRAPSEQEMADHLGLDLDKYRKAVGETGMYNVLSLDAIIDEMHGETVVTQCGSASEEEAPGQAMQAAELKKFMEEGIEALRDKEKLVISLYYRKELSMKEIAKVIGVSEPRVSQIHANAIRKLRVQMSDYLELQQKK